MCCSLDGLSQVSYEADLHFCLDGPFVKSLDFSRDLVSDVFVER